MNEVDIIEKPISIEFQVYKPIQYRANYSKPNS